MSSESEDRITLALTQNDYTVLMLALGVATGVVSRDNDSFLFENIVTLTQKFRTQWLNK